MDVLITTRDARVDVQRDTDLIQGMVGFSEGPDRAWLQHTYIDTCERKTTEVAALWLIESTIASRTLASALGAPVSKSPFDPGAWRVDWIIDGRVARSGRLSLDQAVFLIQMLADQNILDYPTHLFGV